MRNYNNLPQEVITLVAGRTGQEKRFSEPPVWKPFRDHRKKKGDGSLSSSPVRENEP